jgi:hypothetical protein
MPSETIAKLPPFARWLRAELREQRVEAAGLATALSVPRLAVHHWLMGDTVPTPPTCARLAQFLEVPDAAVFRLAGWPKER